MHALLALTALAPAAPDPLVAEVAAGHRSNVERVRTLSAVYTYKASRDGREFTSYSLRYSRDLSGTVMRGVMVKTPSTEVECAILPGEVRRVSRGSPSKPGGGPSVGASRMKEWNPIAAADLWWGLGTSFFGNDLKFIDLAAHLAESDPQATAARDTRDGVPLVKVTSHHKPTKGPASRKTTWFDPARGYMPVRAEATSDDGRGSVEWSGLTAASGAWLPTRRVSDTDDPHGHLRSEYAVTEMKVNEPLPAGATTLRLPAGVVVYDELRGTKYMGHPDWTPAGREEKWEPLRVAPPGDPGPDTGPTRVEPADRSYWLLYGSAAVLAVGLVGLAVRKLHAGRAGAAA